MMRRFSRRHVSTLASLVVLLVAFAFGSARYDHFASALVLRNLLVDNAFLGVAALAVMFAIVLGGIDLSVGSVMAFTGIFVAWLVAEGSVHPLAAFALALVVGTAFGAGQGVIIHSLRLPAFLVTLAGLFLARGAAFAVHPQSLGVKHPFVTRTLGESLALPLPFGTPATTLPIPVLIAAVAFIVAWFVFGYTRFGRSIHAIGDDEAAASLMGVPIARTRIATYSISGFLASLAGILFVLYQESGDPASCRTLELDAIAAVVIGGTLLRGGVGSVAGTAIGVGILGLIQTILVFEGTLSSWWTRIAVGGLVLAFIALQRGLGRMGDGSDHSR